MSELSISWHSPLEIQWLRSTAFGDRSIVTPEALAQDVQNGAGIARSQQIRCCGVGDADALRNASLRFVDRRCTHEVPSFELALRCDTLNFLKGS